MMGLVAIGIFHDNNRSLERHPPANHIPATNSVYGFPYQYQLDLRYFKGPKKVKVDHKKHQIKVNSVARGHK